MVLVLDQGMRVDDQGKEADKQLIKTLSQDIHQGQSSKILPYQRKSKRFESKLKKRDLSLYQALKDARQAFSQMHKDMYQLSQEIRASQSRMYALNKKIHGQPIPDQTPSINANLVQTVGNPTTIIQGIGPDIVTAASGVAASSASLFQTANRSQAISDEKMVPHPTEEGVMHGIYWQLVWLWCSY
ncbi:hypothetical protein PS15p_207006 [Mucor circinelloides]